MSVKHYKKRSTSHSRMRAKQRGIAQPPYASARRYGITLNDALRQLGSDSMLSRYLWFRTMKRGKKVKIYKHNVYVFFNTSDRCITCYPLPEWLNEEYELISFMEKEKKEAYEQRKKRK